MVLKDNPSSLRNNIHSERFRNKCWSRGGTKKNVVKTEQRGVSCSWVLLEKPPFVQLLKNFQTFYATRRFIAVFTKSPPLVPMPKQINPFHTTQSYKRSILIVSTHICLGLPSRLFPSGFPTNILYAFLLSYMCYLTWSSYSPWLGRSNYTWQRVQVMNLLIKQFSTTSHSISLRSKYTPQHPVLKHPQSV
jgi:hypothetical protein